MSSGRFRAYSGSPSRPHRHDNSPKFWFYHRELSWLTIILAIVFPFPFLSVWVGGIIHCDRHTTGSDRIWGIVLCSIAAYLALRIVLMSLIILYKAFAPMSIRNQCLYTPSCSSYGLISLFKYGIILGCTLTLLRIISCHPPNGGNDPPSIRHLRRLIPGASKKRDNGTSSD